jgi:RNA polymerase sigma-70 factor, ECF subfamily
MNEQIFHRLYEQYHRDVFNFLMYLVKDRILVEDLSQEVYIRAIKSYENFQQNASEKTWLFAIAKNVAIDHFRKQAVRSKRTAEHFDWETMQLVAREQSPENQTLMRADLAELKEALEQCTGDQKVVVILRFIQQMSVQETAAILNWTESKVKTTQHRAIHKLKELLEKSSQKEGSV